MYAFRILPLVFTIILFSVCNKCITAQNRVSCNRTEAYAADTSGGKAFNGILLKNNTLRSIPCVFDFPAVGFYDEASLKTFLLKNTDTMLSTDSNRIVVLDNIAALIKSPAHRNFHLLFSAEQGLATLKKYSPLAMMSSFYDKQCHDYQRLAAQLAIQTPYFKKDDFTSYYIFRHNVLDVRIGSRQVFHDFDPGQPGYRFFSGDTSGVYASFSELQRQPALIRSEQFYTWQGAPLCPWISERYYRSLFASVNGQGSYDDLDKVYGFMPRWVIPPGAVIRAGFPDTSLAGRFGALVVLDTTKNAVRQIFKAYQKTLRHQSARNENKVNQKMLSYLNATYAFGFDMNYFYLIQNGLISPGDSTSFSTTGNNYFVRVQFNTGADTIRFPEACLIPLPLHKVVVDSGLVSFTEQEQRAWGWENISYSVTDSLVFDLFNFSAPVVTHQNERKSAQVSSSALVYGPADGFVAPYSNVMFEYYVNPYYYAFHHLLFNIRYCDEGEGVMEVLYE